MNVAVVFGRGCERCVKGSAESSKLTGESPELVRAANQVVGRGGQWWRRAKMPQKQDCVNWLQEQVEGAEQLVPAGESESESELSTTEIELNIIESETSGGPLLFLEASTDNEDLSSEKQMKIATEKVNLAMQNLDTSTSSLSSAEPSVEKCKDCNFDAHSKLEMKQHRIKNHGKKNGAIDHMRKSSRKKISTKRSCNEYSDSYLDDILKDY